MENASQRILIIDTAWLGDVVFTTALIAAARQAWPKFPVDVLVSPRGAEILRGHPQVERLWVYDKHGTQKSLASLLRLGRELRHEPYAIVLCAHPSFRSRTLAWLSRAPVRAGYDGFLSRFLLTHSIANDLAIEPDHVKRRIALIEALGHRVTPTPLYVPVRDDDQVWADHFVKDHGVTEPRLGLVIGSAWETKRWPIENFAAIAGRWIDESGGSVMIFGGQNDESPAYTICESVRHGAVAVIGESLGHVSALLAGCSAVVGNDTGVSFLAIAAGAACVRVLYGCTQVNYTFPPPHRAIHAGVPCCLPRTGHGAHRCRWSDDGPWCMKQISVETVWTALGKVSEGMKP